MTRSILIAGVAIAAFSLAACGKHTQTAADNSIVPAPAATNAPAPTADDFVTKAASTDMFEIAEAKLALKRSTNADVKAFASMMLTDHTKSTAALKAAISSSGQNLVLPAAPPDDMRAKIDALSKSRRRFRQDLHRTAGRRPPGRSGRDAGIWPRRRRSGA